jgi:hypothetical protein
MRFVFAIEAAALLLAMLSFTLALIARIHWRWLRIPLIVIFALFCAFVVLLSEASEYGGEWQKAMYPTMVTSARGCLVGIALGATVLPIVGLWPRRTDRAPFARGWPLRRLILLVVALLAQVFVTIIVRDIYVRRWIARVRLENESFIASLTTAPVASRDDAAPAYRQIYNEILLREKSRASVANAKEQPFATIEEMPEWLAKVDEPSFDIDREDVAEFLRRHEQSVDAAIVASRRPSAVLRPPGSTILDDTGTEAFDAVRAIHRLVSLAARRFARDGQASACWECLSCLRRLQEHVSAQGDSVWSQIGKSFESRRLAVVEAVLSEPTLDARQLPHPLIQSDFSHGLTSAIAECQSAARLLALMCASDVGELDDDPHVFSSEQRSTLSRAWPALWAYRTYHRVFVLADGLANVPGELNRYREAARERPYEQAESEVAWMHEFCYPPTSELASYVWSAPIVLYTTGVDADADRRLADAGVAAAIFRARNGRWPDSVDKLAPEFLDEVPLDPWVGQPLRMRRFDDGLVIYSVGQNETDDGGIDNPSDPAWSPDRIFCLGGAFQKRRLDNASNEE